MTYAHHRRFLENFNTIFSEGCFNKKIIFMESKGQSTLNASKTFQVPVEALYKAWTDAEQLRQWWKPMGLTLTQVENEMREGGKIAYQFEGQEGTSLTIDGTYQEVQPPQRLVYTWNWQLPDEKLNSAYKLEVVFESLESGSSISITQQEDEQQESVKPKASAWDEELSKLASFLESGDKGTDAQNPGNTGVSNAQQQDASSSAMDQEGKPDYGSQNPLQDQQ